MNLQKAGLVCAFLSFGITANADCIFSSPAEVLDNNEIGVGDWRLINEGEDICIWNRTVEDSSVRQVAASVFMSAPLADILEIILAYDNYADVFTYVEQSEILMELPDGYRVFQQLNFPWPARDRFYTIDISLRGPLDGIYQLSWTQSELSARNGRGVETEMNDGLWHLQATDDGGTRVLYFLHTVPGGSLPDWLVNLGNRQALPDTLNDVRKELGIL